MRGSEYSVETGTAGIRAAVCGTVSRPDPAGDSHLTPRVAYIMSRFPKLTETFILYEMLAVESLGTRVEIFPLLRARNSAVHPEGASIARKAWELMKAPAADVVMHPEAQPLVARAHYAPVLNGAVLLSQIWFLLRRPVAYLRALATLVCANFGCWNYLLGGVLLFPKMVYFARRMQLEGITHVHAHFASHPAAAACVIHMLTGIPYSFTAHGADFQVDQHMLREKVQQATTVITISDYNRRTLIGYVGERYRDRIQIIRCGVDHRVFYPAVEGSAASRPNTFTIVCTGTLYEVKGHRYLIEACRRLRERGVPFECHLIGEGPLRASLEALACENDLLQQVRFRGRLTRGEIAEQLRRSDVAVAPSVPTREGRREGIPVVLMEAMASGVAVIASDISGIPELVRGGETGLLVPPRDSPALADALCRLQQDPVERQRLADNGRQLIGAEYDLQRNAAHINELFTSGVPR